MRVHLIEKLRVSLDQLAQPIPNNPRAKLRYVIIEHFFRHWFGNDGNLQPAWKFGFLEITHRDASHAKAHEDVSSMNAVKSRPIEKIEIYGSG